MFSVHLKLGALSAAHGHQKLCRIILGIGIACFEREEETGFYRPSFSFDSTGSFYFSFGSVTPSLPTLSNDDKLRDYVHLLFSSFISQSGSVGINPSSFQLHRWYLTQLSLGGELLGA